MKKFTRIAALFAALATLVSCNKAEQATTLSGLTPASFDWTSPEGETTQLYTLTNKNGVEACITNFGARLVSLMVPDRDGKLQDVVLGFDNIEDYRTIPSDFGASIGRYANRINQGKITLDGKEIQLPQNNFGHCLHGGPKGWQYQIYSGKQISSNKAEFTMHSADGDQNFPGNVVAVVTYTLTDDNSIELDYSATTDATTVINLTNHSYFNLSGDGSKAITDHTLMVNASQYTPVDATFMTTGEILPVASTPMDFTSPRVVGQDIDNFDFEQVKFGNGYDHNWVLNTNCDITKLSAKLYAPSTGIAMEVYTNEPGIQVYSGNFLTGDVVGKHNTTYNQRAAICLETQHYPDSPNKADWPSVVLRPGETYTSRCIYRFITE